MDYCTIMIIGETLLNSLIEMESERESL